MRAHDRGSHPVCVCIRQTLTDNEDTLNAALDESRGGKLSRSFPEYGIEMCMDMLLDDGPGARPAARKTILVVLEGKS